MPQIDASELSFSYDAFTAQAVEFAAGAATPFSYVWTTPNTSNVISALGFLADFTATPSGTVNSINISDTSFQPGLSINGLNGALTDLIDTTNVANNQEKFWDTVLAGQTTIVMPTTNVGFSIMGDAIRSAAGERIVGSNDTFIGSPFETSSSGAVVGDVAIIDDGGTVNGGNDTFTDVLAEIYGDAFDASSGGTAVLGVLRGGNDTITTTDNNLNPSKSQDNIYGDARNGGTTSAIQGGDDTVTLTNISSASNIYLDIDDTAGTIVGGGDTALIETNIQGRSFISFGSIYGDGEDLVFASGTPTGIGGVDTITLRNVTGSDIIGDFSTATNRDITGGNDIITVESTFVPIPGQGNQAASVSIIYGDVAGFSTAGTNAFTGGDDTINIVNAITSRINGDADTITGTDGVFRAGNDTINFTMNRADLAANINFFGDAGNVDTNDATFGNDIFNVDLRGSLSGNGQIFGDVNSLFSASSTARTVTFGDDRITVQADQAYNLQVIGDGAQISFQTASDVVFGNDVITTGAGNDVLFGDNQFAGNGLGTVSGGDDVLDAGMGNDRLDGGVGTNTASFASVARSVFVMLDGIPGTGTTGNLFHAIGQGYDTLRNIQNVTGSSAEDIIIGDANANVLSGGASNDRLVGQDGNDTLNGDGGDDTLSGAMGNDILSGGGGVDLVNGGFGTDVLNGNAGNDTINGGSDNDQLFGGADNDTLNGQGGQDFLQGGSGDDTLNGGSDNDALVGDIGNDILNGDGGNDILCRAMPGPIRSRVGRTMIR